MDVVEELYARVCAWRREMQDGERSFELLAAAEHRHLAAVFVQEAAERASPLLFVVAGSDDLDEWRMVSKHFGAGNRYSFHPGYGFDYDTAVIDGVSVAAVIADPPDEVVDGRPSPVAALIADDAVVAFRLRDGGDRRLLVRRHDQTWLERNDWKLVVQSHVTFDLPDLDAFPKPVRVHDGGDTMLQRDGAVQWTDVLLELPDGRYVSLGARDAHLPGVSGFGALSPDAYDVLEEGETQAGRYMVVRPHETVPPRLRADWLWVANNSWFSMRRARPDAPPPSGLDDGVLARLPDGTEITLEVERSDDTVTIRFPEDLPHGTTIHAGDRQIHEIDRRPRDERRRRPLLE